MVICIYGRIYIWYREPKTQQDARPFGSSMALYQLFGCLDAWPYNCKQTKSLRFPTMTLNVSFFRRINVLDRNISLIIGEKLHHNIQKLWFMTIPVNVSKSYTVYLQAEGESKEQPPVAALTAKWGATGQHIETASVESVVEGAAVTYDRWQRPLFSIQNILSPRQMSFWLIRSAYNNRYLTSKSPGEFSKIVAESFLDFSQCE